MIYSPQQKIHSQLIRSSFYKEEINSLSYDKARLSPQGIIIIEYLLKNIIKIGPQKDVLSDITRPSIQKLLMIEFYLSMGLQSDCMRYINDRHISMPSWTILISYKANSTMCQYLDQLKHQERKRTDSGLDQIIRASVESYFDYNFSPILDKIVSRRGYNLLMVCNNLLKLYPEASHTCEIEKEVKARLDIINGFIATNHIDISEGLKELYHIERVRNDPGSRRAGITSQYNMSRRA